jgi:hypothetical protein
MQNNDCFSSYDISIHWMLDRLGESGQHDCTLLLLNMHSYCEELFSFCTGARQYLSTLTTIAVVHVAL